MTMESKIDFLGKKFVEITMKVVIEYDANELDISDVSAGVGFATLPKTLYIGWKLGQKFTDYILGQLS